MTASLPLTFGAELECFLPVGITHRYAAQRIAEETGLEIHAEGWNHTTRPHWKIVTDGSLGDYQRGAEIVSPILSGEEGIADLHKICTALTAMGAKVNKRCGYHVHIGMRGEALETWKNVLRSYAHFEGQIDNLMPTSRRGDNNAYCRSVTRINMAALEAATDLREVDRAVDLRGAYDRRYAKVNLQAFHRHGTIEFRQHSGTVDAEKATNWVRFLLALVEAARKGKRPMGRSASMTVQARPGSKAAMVGALIMRPQGANSAEINAAVGRTGVNVITIARACGIAIRKEKRGQVTTYYAEGDIATASLDALFDLIEADASLKAFFSGRAASLTGAA